MHPDSAGVSQPNDSYADELIADSGARRLGEPGVFQGNTPDVVEEDVGERAEQQAELVGPPSVTAGAVGVEVELLLLDPVLHVAACTVDVVVKFLRIAFEGRDNVTRIASKTAVFGFHDNTTLPVPCSCRITEFAEAPLLAFGIIKEGFGFFHKRSPYRFESFVFSQSDDVVHAVAITPSQHFPTTEAAVAAKDYLHFRPLLANARHE